MIERRRRKYANKSISIFLTAQVMKKKFANKSISIFFSGTNERRKFANKNTFIFDILRMCK